MKITIQLEEAQMRLLRDTVAAAAQNRKALRDIQEVIDKAIRVDVFIDHKVTMLLAHITRLPASKIKNEHQLEFHLGFGVSRKRFLARPLEGIAREFKESARITISEAAQLETVQDCIDLIKKKIS